MSLRRAARFLGRYLFALFIWMAGCVCLAAQSTPQSAASPSLIPYLGSKIATIEFRFHGRDGDAQDPEADKLAQLIPLKDGDALTSQKLHGSIQALYATGRFANIEVAATRVTQQGLSLTFVTQRNFFIGSVTVLGEPKPPSASQLANATKLELGQLFDSATLTQATDRIKRVLEDNGYYKASVEPSYKLNPDTQQADIFFSIAPSDQALVGKVTAEGDSGMSQEELQDAAKLHPGNRVTPGRITRALQRLRKRYQKRDLLESQVSLAQRRYDPITNTVDFEFRIQRGPTVDIAVEGAHLRQGLIKK